MSFSRITGEAKRERWLLKEPFIISRGKRTHAEVVCLTISSGEHTGRGECQPNSRYHETAEGVIEQLLACFPAENVELLEAAAKTLPSMAARNALDCAIWDLRCKSKGVSATDKLGGDYDKPVPTYFTLSVGTPEEMATAAKRAVSRGISRLKLKLAGNGDIERLYAIREAAQNASIIVDANEAWDESSLSKYISTLENVGVELLEQPLPVGQDNILTELNTGITICADESCHTAADLHELKNKYDAVNIKLDKTGGLTPAIELYEKARAEGFEIMVGCMLGTSLAVAPAMLIASRADYVDLDAPLLLAEDRDFPMKIDKKFQFLPARTELWG